MDKKISNLCKNDKQIDAEDPLNNNNNNKEITSNMSDKPNRPTSLQDINGNSPVMYTEKNKLKSNTNENRRQSLPMSTVTKLQVPNLSLRMINHDYNETLSCPGSPQRRYAPMTPLLTPALSVSSLVSSLDGSLENLHIHEGNTHDEKEKEIEDKQIMEQQLNNKIHLEFEAAHQKDIVNNRLKYFFNTLEREEYYERHSGREIGPINNIFTNSPMVETRSFQEIRDTLTPTNKT